MSIERFFVSNEDQCTYRISPSIVPGGIDAVTDFSRGANILLLAKCMPDDSGGYISEIDITDIAQLGVEEVDVSDEEIKQSEITHLKPGEFYKRSIRLSDGNEGVIVFQHCESRLSIQN